MSARTSYDHAASNEKAQLRKTRSVQIHPSSTITGPLWDVHAAANCDEVPRQTEREASRKPQPTRWQCLGGQGPDRYSDSSRLRSTPHTARRKRRPSPVLATPDFDC
jgi:hypothetical protein